MLKLLAQILTSDITCKVRNHDRRGRDCSLSYEDSDKCFYIAYDWQADFTPLVPNYIDGMIESYSGGEPIRFHVDIREAGYYDDEGEWHELTEQQISEIENLVKP